MFNLVSWTPELDLTEFYDTANIKGFINNSSQRMLVDSLSKEKKWNVWILYYNGKPIGSVGSHSFPEMGADAYRIAARTCVFTDQLDGVYGTSLRTIRVITDHQNPTSQFLIPQCINWAPKEANLYITSNQSKIGTQRKVHNIFCPTLEKKGLMKRVTDLNYRGIDQTIWQLFPDKFLEDLKKYKKW